jgi:2-oxoisovalerate dehydrogenase E1 component
VFLSRCVLRFSLYHIQHPHYLCTPYHLHPLRVVGANITNKPCRFMKIHYNREGFENEELLEIYAAILKPRMIEEKMLIALRQGKISKWFSGFGQEAISVGTSLVMNPEEHILTMHRNLGVFTSRNIPLFRLFSQFAGKASGFTKGRDRSFHFGSKEHNMSG